MRSAQPHRILARNNYELRIIAFRIILAPLTKRLIPHFQRLQQVVRLGDAKLG